MRGNSTASKFAAAFRLFLASDNATAFDDNRYARHWIVGAGKSGVRRQRRLVDVNWKYRKEVAVDLRLIYQASTTIEVEMQRDEFARKWDAVYPMVSQIWRRNWERILPFFAYPGEIRKVIDTTNTIESLTHIKQLPSNGPIVDILFVGYVRELSAALD